jgi:hypothetical protein
MSRDLSIYVQGGHVATIVTGGAAKYMLEDIKINIDILNNPENKTGDEHVLYTFKLKNMDELDNWLESDEGDFLARCVRKFNLHMVYSNAVKGFFFDLVKLFESYVIEIMTKAKIDVDARLAEYEEYNNANNLDSSSIILYKFGKDPDINKYLEEANPNLLEYITDEDRWSYKGWCPLVPDIRLKHLLEFPLDYVAKLLNLNIDLDKFKKALTKIKKINHPDIPKGDESPINYTDKESKIAGLHERIKNIENELKQWENYYINSAEQIIEIVDVFKKFISGFGVENQE